MPTKYFILICLLLGIFLTALAAKREAIRKDNWCLSYPISCLLWPLLFMVAWKELLSNSNKPNRFNLTSDLALLNLAGEQKFLNDQELLIFKYLKEDIEDNNITEFGWYDNIKQSLELLWDIDLHPSLFLNYQRSKIRF